MPLDMQDLADRAQLDDALELAHGGKAALVVAGAERHAGRLHRLNRALRLGAGQRQRLLAPDRLAGRGHFPDLLDVQGMRRRQQDRLHLWIGDRIVKLARQPETVARRQFARRLRFFADAMHDAQALALALDRIENGLAPAPQTDHGYLNHACPDPIE